MTDKERLEEIKEIDITPLCFYLDDMTNFDGKLLKEQWKWLIKRAEELEEERDEWKNTSQYYYMMNQELREQNQRHGEAMVSALSEIEYALYSQKSLKVKEHYLKNAKRYINQALESEQRRIRELKEENQRFKKALEFYADPMIWREGNRIKDNTFEMPLANNDNGHKARKALEGTDNE